LYKHLDIVSLVIVQDIVDEKIVDKRMHLPIYVLDLDKIILQTRLYITKSIKTSIILDNNVLEMPKNKISLHLHKKRMQIDSVQMSIKFISLKALSISSHVIFVIVFTTLKLCLKTTSKKTIKQTKSIKFAIRIDQRQRVNVIKIDASF